MMEPILWEPMRQLDALDRVMDSLLATTIFWPRSVETRSVWQPAADFLEDNEGYTLRFDLPGVDKKDIDIRLDDGVLTVSGERKPFRSGHDGEAVRWQESDYGRFERSLRLPDDVDESEVKASYHNGVLEVRLAKTESARARRIPIAN